MESLYQRNQVIVVFLIRKIITYKAAKVKTMQEEVRDDLQEKYVFSDITSNGLIWFFSSNGLGTAVIGEHDISSLSPMAAATSALLKKGMTLTQVRQDRLHYQGLAFNLLIID